MRQKPFAFAFALNRDLLVNSSSIASANAERLTDVRPLHKLEA